MSWLFNCDLVLGLVLLDEFLEMFYLEDCVVVWVIVVEMLMLWIMKVE